MVRQCLVYFVITNVHWIDRLIYKSSCTGPNLPKQWPEKTANISWRHHWFPWEMTSKCNECHYPDLDCSSNWLNHEISHVAQPIKSTTQIWVVTHYQHGISALILRKSFCGQASGGIAKCTLFIFLFFGLTKPMNNTVSFFFLILHEQQYWEINTIKGKYSCPENFINCQGNLSIYYYGRQCPSSRLATPKLKMTTEFYNETIG